MKKSRFKSIINILFFVFIILVIIYNEKITTYVVSNYIYNKNEAIEITKNEYALERNYSYVQITDDFVAHDYQHLLNIIYTILDSGNDEAFFYCDDDYTSCLSDLDYIIPSNVDEEHYDVLADINNLVHPYNSYQKLTVVTNNYGKVVVKVAKQYSKKNIVYINNEIDKISLSIEKEGMTNEQKILAFHDYIINTTKYDKDRASNLKGKSFKNSDSHTAYGLLKNHVALCGGYSDIMSIYMNKINVQNIRISSDKHVWNLVYSNGKWLHLDATWDDPVTQTGSQILMHDYFLIDTDTLFRFDLDEHNFNQEFYKESK